MSFAELLDLTYQALWYLHGRIPEVERTLSWSGCQNGGAMSLDKKKVDPSTQGLTSRAVSQRKVYPSRILTALQRYEPLTAVRRVTGGGPCCAQPRPECDIRVKEMMIHGCTTVRNFSSPIGQCVMNDKLTASSVWDMERPRSGGGLYASERPHPCFHRPTDRTRGSHIHGRHRSSGCGLRIQLPPTEPTIPAPYITTALFVSL